MTYKDAPEREAAVNKPHICGKTCKCLRCGGERVFYSASTDQHACADEKCAWVEPTAAETIATFLKARCPGKTNLSTHRLPNKE